MTSTMRTRTLAALAAMPLLIALLAGCSSAPNEPTNEAPTPSSSAPGGAKDFKGWQVEFFNCLEDQGVDTGNGSGITMTPETQGLVQEAVKLCTDKLGPAPADTSPKDEGDDDASLQERLKIAECFRENGLDYPDPGSGIQPPEVPDDIMKTCAPNGLGSSSSTGGQ